MSGNPMRWDRVGAPVYRSAAYAPVDPDPVPPPADPGMRRKRRWPRPRPLPHPLQAGGPSWFQDRLQTVRRMRLSAILSISLHLAIAIALAVSFQARPRPRVQITRIPVQLVSLGGPAQGNRASQGGSKAVRNTPPPPERKNTQNVTPAKDPAKAKSDPKAKPKPEPPKKDGRPVPKKEEPAAQKSAPAEPAPATPSKGSATSADGLTRTRSELPLPGGGIGSMELGVGGPLTEYSYYLAIVRQKIASHWDPPAGVPGVETAVTVKFRIDRGGDVSAVIVEEPSGSVPFDTAGIRAVKDAAPMPPLPQDLTDDWVGIHLRFVVAE